MDETKIGYKLLKVRISLNQDRMGNNYISINKKGITFYVDKSISS